MKVLSSVLGGALMALAGFVVGVNVPDHDNQPSCPTEDSCAIDYHHGKWTVTEVQP